MQINCTVFIQIINFWVTYYFLKSILLRPLIEVINKKSMAKKALAEHLKEKEDFIHALLKKKNQELETFQTQVQFKYKKPIISLSEIKSELSYTRDDKQIKELINSSKDLIIKEVSNAL